MEKVQQKGIDGQVGGVGAGARCTPGGGAPGGGALPCLRYNNSDRKSSDDPERELNRVIKSVYKQAFTLSLNVDHFFSLVGLERVGFLTITSPDHLSYWTREGWREASRRYNNFTRRVFPEIFGSDFSWVKIIEPTMKGRIHFHVLVECRSDIRTGVDWEAFKAGDYRSASKELRRCWSMLREKAPLYGLGRCELLPVRTNVEACRKYVGKYLNKSITGEWGAGIIEGKKRPPNSRRIAYSSGWRVARSNFAWVEAGLKWRKAVAYVADVMGFRDEKDFVRTWGKKWAYHRGESIIRLYESREIEPININEEMIESRVMPESRRFVRDVVELFGGTVVLPGGGA